MKKKPILLPLAAALAAAFPAGAQAKVADAGLSVGRAQAAFTQNATIAPAPLLALPNGSPATAELGHYSHHSHHSHHSHRSHYSSSGGGHYSHSSHSSHSSHYSSS
jgi:hypothetical protein